MNDGEQKGILNVYDALKGFGFIRRAEGKDVFVHFTDFAGDEKDAHATIGSQVEFELDPGAAKQKPRAINVKIIG